MEVRISFLFSSRRRHTRCYRDWSSDVCSSDLNAPKRIVCLGEATYAEDRKTTVGLISVALQRISLPGRFLPGPSRCYPRRVRNRPDSPLPAAAEREGGCVHVDSFSVARLAGDILVLLARMWEAPSDTATLLPGHLL